VGLKVRSFQVQTLRPPVVFLVLPSRRNVPSTSKTLFFNAWRMKKTDTFLWVDSPPSQDLVSQSSLSRQIDLFTDPSEPDTYKQDAQGRTERLIKAGGHKYQTTNDSIYYPILLLEQSKGDNCEGEKRREADGASAVGSRRFGCSRTACGGSAVATTRGIR
jgi:hypothetical protein